MAQLNTELILETTTGIRQAYDHREEDVPASDDYTVAHLKDTNSSMYIVYELPKYNAADALKKRMIIDSTEKKDLGFVARSLRGFNCEGIVLFECYHFSGPDAYMFTKSSSDITDEFPSIVHGGGISSIMVFAGNWLLYEHVGFRGEIPVPDTDGSDYIFKERHSYQLPIGAGNGKVLSVKRIK